MYDQVIKNLCLICSVLLRFSCRCSTLKPKAVVRKQKTKADFRFCDLEREWQVSLAFLPCWGYCIYLSKSKDK